MGKKPELEQKLVQLKLEKRDLVLAGKDTSRIDQEIKFIQMELDKEISVSNKINI